MCDVGVCYVGFFLMIRRPPSSTLTDTLFPDPALCRSWQPGEPIVIDLAAGRDLANELIAAKPGNRQQLHTALAGLWPRRLADQRSEEHTSELQSLMRISYAVFRMKQKKTNTASNV